ncbi:hypothetical protein H9655_20640 [Cytobacillus sp. Sa5YUA1]|uniref:Uncharacterized protein n=1 Tax=Cytobacillus stercorigallinarum TaxID=2762240 RepID=A0ABR8QV92_9BACI|nr:hypothetical protein [Cytobacillus stercorigallinarum]MBD7939453.1 hypothetical protein [Cytobacillus stercorigallinarum]
MTTTRRKVTISTDMRKVKKLLKEVPEDRQPIATGIYNELVFMQNTLATLKAQVEDEGPVNMFKQGKQEFLREHPALKAYNTTIQRFSLLYKQLIDLLPRTEIEAQNDALMDFINGG